MLILNTQLNSGKCVYLKEVIAPLWPHDILSGPQFKTGWTSLDQIDKQLDSLVIIGVVAVVDQYNHFRSNVNNRYREIYPIGL